VRTIQIGENGKPFSYELCGGTHVEHTGDIGLFLITSEGSAAAGIRRIEAVTGRGAYEIAKKRNEILLQTAIILKANALEVANKALSVQKELSDANKQLITLRNQVAHKGIEGIIENVPLVSGIPLLTAALPGANAVALRQLADRFREKYPSGVALLVGTEDGRATLIAAVTKDLVARGLQAGDLVKQAAEVLEGSGGGKPELAQAGGKDNGHVAEALAKAEPWVKSKLGS